ncbi:MAG: sulfotransferase [Planctomycetota bacterium]|nr:sulfotransferase [Planctomycetota bacterium]
MEGDRKSRIRKRFRRIGSAVKQLAISATGRYVRSVLMPVGGHRFVLILAHMRSGSTLLSHLLMGHPQVLGVGERNLTYSGPDDLDRLAAILHWESRQFIRRFPWILDQINHDRLLPDGQLLHLPNVKTLFLIREPLASVSSIVRTFEPRYGGWTVERAAEYYEQRLSMLRDYSDVMSRDVGERTTVSDVQSKRSVVAARACFTTYDELVDQPRQVLPRIQAFLGLDEPISEHYPLQSCTGKRGDPSPIIRAGTIVRNRPTPIEIPAEIRQRLERAYADCRTRLSRFTNPLEHSKAA